ncbi:MAG: hypothetical protein KC548_04855 [Nanoarchaeota archaeon]|nr:hypothetical protein [Nanoarchaeota archaeon]
MSSFDPTIKRLIGQILAIEKEYRHIGTLVEANEDDICHRIVAEIEKVAKNEN